MKPNSSSPSPCSNKLTSNNYQPSSSKTRHLHPNSKVKLKVNSDPIAHLHRPSKTHRIIKNYQAGGRLRRSSPSPCHLRRITRQSPPIHPAFASSHFLSNCVRRYYSTVSNCRHLSTPTDGSTGYFIGHSFTSRLPTSSAFILSFLVT